MKRFSVMFPFLLFLSACSFNGIMSESYDGEKIAADKDAAEIFSEENLLDTEGLESRYAFLNSSTEFEGIADGGTKKTLSPGEYMTGEDIEPGRYTASAENAASIVIYDEYGDRLLESALNYFSTDVVLELQPGYRVDYITREGSIVLQPVEEAFGPMIPAGLHTVGEYIEAGTYILYTDELPVRRAGSEDDIYMNPKGMSTLALSSMDTEMDLDYGIQVMLNEGDTIVAEHPFAIEKD